MNDLEPDVVDYVAFRDLEPDGVIEQPFKERYNSFLEIPISFIAALLIPLGLLFLLIYYLKDNKVRDTKPPAITFMDGDDDKGVGSPGSGGSEELALGQAPPQSALDALPKAADISQVKEELQQAMKIEGVTDVEVPESLAAALGTLDDKLRKKITGSARGSGKPGTGGQENGGGIGGTGADSTRARALRWVIKFDKGGRDYVNQIGGLGGIILLQFRDDNGRMYIFRTPQNPGPPKEASDADLAEMETLLLFQDTRIDSVANVAEVLGLNYTPPMFMVRFPKSMEAKLEKLERDYNSRDPKQIKETVYRVVKAGGGYDLIVIDQKMR